MVSDFVDEHNGFLALTAEEYEVAKASNPNARMYACTFLEYGENREGYWTQDRFIDQMEKAVRIAEIKYPKVEGWRHVWVFDHSSCHAAMADDALDVSKMNVKPGGIQCGMVRLRKCILFVVETKWQRALRWFWKKEVYQL